MLPLTSSKGVENQSTVGIISGVGEKEGKKGEGARVGSHSGYVVFCSKDHTGSKCVYESTVGLFECSVCGSVGQTMGEVGSSRYYVK